jgi:hypothetical protein
MQQQKQHSPPIFNLEPGGMIGISTAAASMPTSASRTTLGFTIILGLSVGLILGIAGALMVADRQISEAKNTAKLEQLQRQQLQLQIDKFCSENGGRNGR